MDEAKDFIQSMREKVEKVRLEHPSPALSARQRRRILTRWFPT